MTTADAATTQTAQLEEQSVRAEIEGFFAGRWERAKQYGEHFAALWNTAATCIGGGKLLRPRLLLGAYEALAPSSADVATREAVIGLAVATEVLHYAFLLHDDVIDGDLVRRGQPNFLGSLLARPKADHDPERELHWARSSGILMGDLLLSDAHQLFARSHAPEWMRESLLDALDNAVTESMVGEYLDVALCDAMLLPPTLEDVLAMTRLKTATYSFELPLRVGAILAGSSLQTQDWLAEIGTALGFAFQLQDDLLSTFGDPAQHGKDTFSDLREGKETAIIAFARTSGKWSEIAPGFGDPQLSTGRAEHLRLRLVECGALTKVLNLVEETLDGVRERLQAADAAIPPTLVAFLQRATDSIEGRHV